jgi:hypothetical protein
METEKHKMLMRRVRETKQELDHSWQDLKRDSMIVAASAVSAYIGVRAVMWVFSGKKKEKKKNKQPKETEIRYVQVETPKKSGGILGMVINRATSLILDMVLDKVQDNLPARKKDNS